VINLYNFSDVKVPFNNKWKRIAISLSGGADSALLAYLLATTILKLDTEIHIISHIRCWKTKPWQEYDSLNVYRWLTQRFPKINFVRHVNFIPPEIEWGSVGPTITDEYGKLVSGDNVELRAFAEYTCFKYKIDAYYNAVTRNPKDVEFEGMPTRNIDLEESNSHLLLMEHMGRIVSHPFRFTEKSKIIEMYHALDITELLAITRSCEGTFTDITYNTYKPGQYVPLCKECFWCKERRWAIETAK
jgi:7-cyano-7-deazaguanine synthase in queuosine biosynthesis